MKRSLFAALLMCWPLIGRAETPEEWIALGARVHGAFGSFIPLRIKIGLDAVNRLNPKPRELTVLYYDGAASPCACFADGTAIATNASAGQRTLVIALEKAPDVSLAGRSTVFWGPPPPAADQTRCSYVRATDHTIRSCANRCCELLGKSAYSEQSSNPGADQCRLNHV